jgi:CRISPR-associated protein Csb1
MTVTLDQLLEAVSPTGPCASISITAKLRPTGPAGSKVAPPSYPDSDRRSGPYLIDQRWIDGQERRVVLLDSEQSQANRCELALRDAIDDGLVQLPLFVLTKRVVTEAGEREVRLTSLDLPHRYADAYLRDSLLDGESFDKTEIGKRLRLAEPRNARVLFEREPYSLVYGAWDSHRKGRQAKFPRIYDSTVIGLDPITGARAGGRLDPIGLTGAQKQGADGWEFVAEGEKTKGAKLSEIGHGNALDAGRALGQVAITGAQRLTTVHLGALSGLRFGSDVSAEATQAGRAALVALALLGDRLAFARSSVFLRSGCELATVAETALFERSDGSGEPFELDISGAVALFGEAATHAGELGLAMATDHVALDPQKGLAEAIEYAYTKAEGGD